MSWLRLDDGMPDHRRVKRALREGGIPMFGLHVLGLLHASRYLTDGYVEREFVDETFEFTKTRERVGAAALSVLEQRELWVPADQGGWRIHDYLDHNPSRAEVEAKRRRDAERKARGRGGSPQGVQPESERTDDGVHEESARPVPSRPIPVPSADAAARAPDVVVRVMTTFASAGFPLQEETVTNAMSRFPAIDLEAEAKGCVEYLRANPGRDAGLTFFRWLERAKPLEPDKRETTARRGSALRELMGRTD